MEDNEIFGDGLNNAFKISFLSKDSDSFAPREELFPDSVFDQLYAEVLQPETNETDEGKTRNFSTTSSELNVIAEESDSAGSSPREPGIWGELVPADLITNSDMVLQHSTEPPTLSTLLQPDSDEVTASDGETSDTAQSSSSCPEEEFNLVKGCRCRCAAAAAEKVGDGSESCTCSEVAALLPNQQNTEADVYDWLTNAVGETNGAMFSRRSKSKKEKTPPAGSSQDYALWKRNEDKAASCCSPLRSSQTKKPSQSAPNASTGGLPVLTPSPYGSLRDVARPLEFRDSPGYAASEPACRRRSDDTNSVCSSTSDYQYQYSDIGDYLSLSPPHTQRLAHYNRYKARTSPTRQSNKGHKKPNVYSPIRTNNGSQILTTTLEKSVELNRNDHTPQSSTEVELTPLFSAALLETASESASVGEESLALSDIGSTRSFSVTNIHVETTPLTTAEPERPVSCDSAVASLHFRDLPEVISTCSDSYTSLVEASEEIVAARHLGNEEEFALCVQTASPVANVVVEERITPTYCSKVARADNSELVLKQNEVDSSLEKEALESLEAFADIPYGVMETLSAKPVVEEMVVPVSNSNQTSALPADLSMTSNAIDLEQYASRLAKDAIQAAINQPNQEVFKRTGKMSRSGLSLKVPDGGEEATTQPLIKTTPSSEANLTELESREYRLPTDKEVEDDSHLSPHTPVADPVNVSYPTGDLGDTLNSTSSKSSESDTREDNSNIMKDSSESFLFRVTQAIQNNWPAFVFAGVAVTVGAIAVKLRMPSWIE